MAELAIEAVMDGEEENLAPARIEPPAPSPRPKRRKLLFAGIAAMVLTASATGGYMVVARGAESGAFNGPAAPTYVEVPPITVNLRVPGGQARFLKLRFIIVAAGPDHADAIRARLPVVLDALQPFLRELRPEDLNGSAAVFRIKEEMMVRARPIFGEGAVTDFLIQDLVQQ